ncbi:MAG: hypothetical protein IJ428_02870 [Clostridia bacterium]|nr:hypothetical protein [Clostridia bacterium]
MAEFVHVPLQTVDDGDNVIFTDTVSHGPKCVFHRPDSGVVILRGITNCCYARYRVSFGGNLSIPVGGIVGPISVALAINGEALGGSEAVVTPVAVGDEQHVYISTFVTVPRGCCFTVAVENTSDQAIDVTNANLIVTREEG